VEIFLPNTQELIPGGRLNTPRSGHAACVYNDTIYVFGGQGIHSADILSSVVIYHPTITAIPGNEIINPVPRSYTIMTSYPNPFNSSTRIDINLPERNYVELDIYDIQGRRVQRIFADYLHAGPHHFSWDTAHRGLASGIYMAVLRAPGKIYTHKMLLIK
jgi:hypothetical protein